MLASHFTAARRNLSAPVAMEPTMSCPRPPLEPLEGNLGTLHGWGCASTTGRGGVHPGEDVLMHLQPARHVKTGSPASGTSSPSAAPCTLAHGVLVRAVVVLQ